MEELEPEIVESSERAFKQAIWQRVGVLGLLVLVTATAVMFAARGGDGNDDGGEDDQAESNGEITIQEVDLAGPYDGLESIGLPLAVTPDIGLAEGDLVELVAEGFAPGTVVGVVECWIHEGGGSVDDCDLGGVVIAHADEQGMVFAEFPVRRYLALEGGTFDCALGGLVEGCRIAAGNVDDYDESGTARIFFDPEVEGEEPPVFTVEPSSGLTDGQTLTVSGRGFRAGESAFITQCVIGGMNGTGVCFGQNATGQIVVGEDGTFTATVAASRLVFGGDGEIDCFDDPYGCRVVVQAGRTPNPVALTYDGAFRPPPGAELTVTPSEALTHLQEVRVDGFDLRTDGGIAVRQCVDQGPEGVWCRHFGEGAHNAPDDVAVTEGGFSTVVAVTQWIWNGAGEAVDCGGAGRTCYLWVLGAGIDMRLPVRFDQEGLSPPTPTLSADPTTSAEGRVSYEVTDLAPGWIVRLCIAEFLGAESVAGFCEFELAAASAAASGTLEFPAVDPEGLYEQAAAYSIQLVPMNQQSLIAYQYALVTAPG